MTAIRVRAGTDAGGWVEVPRLADAAERERWAAAVADAVARAHGDRYDRAAEPAIRQVMAAVAADRGETDLLVLSFLPTPGPIASTVRVRLAPVESVGWWRDQGFALSPIRTEGLGHGMLATRTIEEQAEGLRIVAHQCVFVFADEDVSVAVFMEPTASLVFDRMQDGLMELIGSMTAEFDDGRLFTGVPVSAVPGTDADAWDIGRHAPA